MNKRVYAIIGMVMGLLLVLSGLLTTMGVMGGKTSYATSAPYSYDNGYASFGGDFYTYVNNNAAEAARAARVAADNLNNLGKLAKNVCGFFLIGFGVMEFCVFGILYADCKEQFSVPSSPKEEPAESSCRDEDSPEEQGPLTV